MKIELVKTTPRRGGKVEVGNVYSNIHGHNVFKIVLGIVKRDKHDKPWKNVAIIKVDIAGNIVGASMEPEAYMSQHQDHVGVVSALPDLKVEWLP